MDRGDGERDETLGGDEEGDEILGEGDQHEQVEEEEEEHEPFELEETRSTLRKFDRRLKETASLIFQYLDGDAELVEGLKGLVGMEREAYKMLAMSRESSGGFRREMEDLKARFRACLPSEPVAPIQLPVDDEGPPPPPKDPDDYFDDEEWQVPDYSKEDVMEAVDVSGIVLPSLGYTPGACVKTVDTFIEQIDEITEKVVSETEPHLDKSQIPNIMEDFDQFLKGLKSTHDDDIEEMDSTMTERIDPWSKKPISQPVRSNVCSHIYDKESVEQMLTKKDQKMRCPYVGCQGVFQKTDLTYL